MFRALALAALATAAEALQADGLLHQQVQTTTARPKHVRSHASKSVLILGCSVDRYAVEWFCGHFESFLHVACTDKKRDLAMGFVFHPGVGYHGDLKPPFYNRTRYGNITSSIIGRGQEALFEHSERMVGERFPNMVVVDSSLWDLANWASRDGRDEPSPKRLQQWCDHDLGRLMYQVQRSYNKSRIVFRTAPITAKPHRVEGVEQFSEAAIEFMHQCVKAKSRSGKLFGTFDVIDYHRLVDQLMPKNKSGKMMKDATQWLLDGYHPNKEPARLYINEILRLIDKPPVAAKDWAQKDPQPAVFMKMDADGRKAELNGTTGEPLEWSRNRASYNI